MSAGEIEGSQGPEYAAVQQLEPEMPRVPVEVCGVVPVQIAQSAGGLVTGKNLVLTAQTATKLLGGDETRGSVLIIGGGAFFLGFSKNDCDQGIAKFPGGVLIPVRNNSPIWVKAADADTYVSAIVEMWTR